MPASAGDVHARVLRATLLPIINRAAEPPARPSDDTRLELQRAAIIREIATGLDSGSSGGGSSGSGSSGSGSGGSGSYGRTIVEFGAGNGALSRELYRTGVAQRCVLVDKNQKRLERGDDQFQRLCLDVSEMTPEQLRQLVSDECIVLSNHMCGSALDVSVRCATDTWRSHDAPPAARLSGVVAVTCCHHACTWFTYLGREYLESEGLGAADFETIRRWSRMAPRRDKPATVRPRVMEAAASLGITADEAAALGSRCRQLLDTGRAHYLQRCGFDVELVQHVSFALTADNVMILASRKSAPHAHVPVPLRVPVPASEAGSVPVLQPALSPPPVPEMRNLCIGGDDVAEDGANPPIVATALRAKTPPVNRCTPTHFSLFCG